MRIQPARRLIDTVAWVLIEDGRILCARPRGKDEFYVPGGKREGAETDLETLVREIDEELTVALLPESVRHIGTYEAELPGAAAISVRMACYSAEYAGTLAPSSEIAELAWFGSWQRAEVPPVDQLLFDDLVARGLLPVNSAPRSVGQ
ncbi:NUDIX domain-containing protein [Nocardia sp. NPDC052254]|uniref:NUDIX hydrolase n=1 Tax=Nocardia sp. NPDC052254 TaxID=3155681 RepID=UPI00341FFCBD